MYIRTIKRKNKDGSVVEYVQLAHNVRHPDKGYPKAEVIYSFGRREQLDIEALKRLVKSISRFFAPEDQIMLQAKDDILEPIEFVRSRSAGGAYLLKSIWNRLKIGAHLKKAIDSGSFTVSTERALFAMVSNYALYPSSKSDLGQWLTNEVYLGSEDQLKVHHIYSAMDLLLKYDETIHKEIFRSVVNLLNLTDDLIFFDTIETYYKIDAPDPSNVKICSNKKYEQDDLSKAYIGFAATREGIPVRCWWIPGKELDSKFAAKVKKELKNCCLGHVVWCVNNGMCSDENRRLYQYSGGQSILCEKLTDKLLNEISIVNPGRFKIVSKKLHVKEAILGSDEDRRNCVIAFNPQQANLERIYRKKNLQKLSYELQELNRKKKTEIQCNPALFSFMGRYIKELKNGKLKINRAKVKHDEKLDGKYLLYIRNQNLFSEDIVSGCKQIIEVERSFRTLKDTLCQHPVHHTKEDMIRLHVLISWMALLLVRITEMETGMSWPVIRSEMQRIHLGEFLSKKTRILMHTELTPNQEYILKPLKIKPPERILDIKFISES